MHMLTAFQIRQLMHQTFQRQALILVPECNWTGHECDLLVVHKSMRIIDVEIKISRADFKRDAAKDKWWHRIPVEEARARGLDWWTHREHDDWPRKVWKHYFAMPREIWKPELADVGRDPARRPRPLRRAHGEALQGRPAHRRERRHRHRPPRQPAHVGRTGQSPAGRRLNPTLRTDV
jgi:hypothetical protein